MQDRYAGDVGDFSKFGLLKALAPSGKTRLGLVWYLMPDGGPPGDGRHTEYLRDPKRFRDCDSELFDLLRLVANGKRNVASIESLGVLPNATFYSRRLSFEGVSPADRPSVRGQWLEDAVKTVQRCDLVCVDPDNGLQVRSAARHSKRGPKYVYYDELADYIHGGQSVVAYQHMPREAAEPYARWRARELRQRLQVEDVWALLWRAYSRRIYFIIPNGREPELRPRIEAFLFRTPWGEHFEPVLFP